MTNKHTDVASHETCPLQQALAEANPQPDCQGSPIVAELALLVRRLAWDARSVPADRDDLSGKLQRAGAALDFLVAHGLEAARPSRSHGPPADGSTGAGARRQSVEPRAGHLALKAAVQLRRGLLTETRINALEIDQDTLRSVALGANAPCEPAALQHVLEEIDRLEAERASTLLAIAKLIGSLPEAIRLRLANGFDLSSEVVCVRLHDLQLLASVLWPSAHSHAARQPVASSAQSCDEDHAALTA